MKKILATLLVATMLLSCMTFVSFASAYTVYTVENFPYAELGGYDEDDGFTDPIAAYYYTNIKSDLFGGIGNSDRNAQSLYQALKTLDTDGETTVGEVPSTIPAGQYVLVPIMVDKLGEVSVNLSWDPAYLTYVGYNGDYGPNTKDLDEEAGKVNFNGFNTAGTDVNGFFGAVGFKVNDATDDNKGDENGNKTVEVTITLDSGSSADGTPATLGNSKCAIAISGLKEGQPAVQDKDIAAEDLTIAPVKAMAEDADAAGMAADLANFGVEVPGDVASNAYVYNAIFATIPTTGYNAPSAYGIILNTAAGTQKVTVDNAVNGKFGVFVYGSTYALDGIESYQVFCTVNGVDVLGEVVAY